MLKKLRNKMLLMNMISTFCLIILAFAAIFTITYNSVQNDIEESLFRAFSFHRPMHFMRQDDMRRPAENADGGINEYHGERVLRDMKSFSVFVDKESNVMTDSIFGENSELYKSVAKEALSQDTQKGEFRSEDIVWRFDTRELGDGARIIALVDITAEKSFLVNLIISFLICAAILSVLICMISIYFANKAIAPVKESWEKQKQFVADASHELKTPLAAINANIDVLLAEKVEKSEVKWLQYIKSEVARLSHLTESLLLMAKIDSGTQMQMLRLSFSDVVEKTALNFEAVAYEKGVRLQCDIEKNIFINGDEAQLARLCTTLMDNAIKYSPKNETVTVKVQRSARGSALLRVHNNGEHIPKSEQAKIFDRFYRTDKSRSSSGYGLGLAIAKEIVTVHKGKISVSSSCDSGTEFSVVLPE